MEVLTVQNQYNDQHYSEISTTRIKTCTNKTTQLRSHATQTETKTAQLRSHRNLKKTQLRNDANRSDANRDWSARSLSKNAQQEPLQNHRHQHHHQHQRNRSHQKKLKQQQQHIPPDFYYTTEDEQQNDDDSSSIDATAVNELSVLLLAELRAAKTRNLTCTEVSLPSDLTQRIATDIVRVSEREPCGIRGCTVFVEYEEDTNSVKRIAKLKLDPEMVSTFEVYLTLRQDKKGWTSLLPQFIKGLSRTITISPDYTINKRKLYSHDSN